MRIGSFIVPVSSGPPPFVDPTSLSGLKLWLRADLGISPPGGPVSLWTDSSGNGNSASGGGLPTFVASDASFAGKPSVFFPAPGGTLKTGPYTGIVGATTVVGAAIFLGAGSAAGIIASAAPMAPSFAQLVNLGGSVAFNVGGGSASYAAGFTTKVFSGTWDGTTSVGGLKVYEDISLKASGTATSVPTNPGSYSIGTGDAGVRIAELVVYNRVLTGIELLSQLVPYMMARYGI